MPAIRSITAAALHHRGYDFHSLSAHLVRSRQNNYAGPPQIPPDRANAQVFARTYVPDVRPEGTTASSKGFS
jgi:hypothetical protein